MRFKSFACFLFILQIPAVLRADPSFISVFDICAENGVEKYGLRKCDGGSQAYRTRLAANLESKVKNVIYHYYRGKILEFDPTSRGHFCTADQSGQPLQVGTVCNIAQGEGNGSNERNHKGDRCGQSNVSCNRTCFELYNETTMSLPASAQSTCGSTLYQLATSTIDEARSYLMIPGRAVAALATLSNRSEMVNKLMSECNDWRDSNSDGFCALTSGDQFSLRNCPREMSWVRGARVQLWQKYFEEVKREIRDQNKIRIETAGGGSSTRPCGAFGVALSNLINGIDSPDPSIRKPGIKYVETEIKSRYRATADELNTDNTEGCFKAEKGDTSSLDNSNFTEDRGGITRYNKHISQSFCNLAYARKHAEYLFERLAVCEIMTRTKREFYSRYFNLDALLGVIRDEVVEPCINHAEDEADWDCWRGCAYGHLKRCYRNGEPGENDQDGLERAQAVGGIIGLFTREIRRGIAVQNPIPLILNPSLRMQGERDEDIPLCSSLSSLSLIPLFRRRRKFKIIRKSWKMYIVRFLALLIIVAHFNCGGCSSTSVCNDCNMESENSTTASMPCISGDDEQEVARQLEEQCPPPPEDPALPVGAESPEAPAMGALADAASELSPLDFTPNAIATDVASVPRRTGQMADSAADAAGIKDALNHPPKKEEQGPDKSKSPKLAGGPHDGSGGDSSKSSNNNPLGFQFGSGGENTAANDTATSDGNSAGGFYTAGVSGPTFTGADGGGGPSSFRRGLSGDSSIDQGGQGVATANLNGISGEGSLTLFEIVNRRYDKWGKVNFAK